MIAFSDLLSGPNSEFIKFFACLAWIAVYTAFKYTQLQLRSTSIRLHDFWQNSSVLSESLFLLCCCLLMIESKRKFHSACNVAETWCARTAWVWTFDIWQRCFLQTSWYLTTAMRLWAQLYFLRKFPLSSSGIADVCDITRSISATTSQKPALAHAIDGLKCLVLHFLPSMRAPFR